MQSASSISFPESLHSVQFRCTTPRSFSSPMSIRSPTALSSRGVRRGGRRKPALSEVEWGSAVASETLNCNEDPKRSLLPNWRPSRHNVFERDYDCAMNRVLLLLLLSSTVLHGQSIPVRPSFEKYPAKQNYRGYPRHRSLTRIKGPFARSFGKVPSRKSSSQDTTPSLNAGVEQVAASFTSLTQSMGGSTTEDLESLTFRDHGSKSNRVIRRIAFSSPLQAVC